MHRWILLLLLLLMMMVVVVVVLLLTMLVAIGLRFYLGTAQPVHVQNGECGQRYRGPAQHYALGPKRSRDNPRACK